jgi:hypothetical protein
MGAVALCLAHHDFPMLALLPVQSGQAEDSLRPLQTEKLKFSVLSGRIRRQEAEFLRSAAQPGESIIPAAAGGERSAGTSKQEWREENQDKLT